jgi:hypothetical protein
MAGSFRYEAEHYDVSLRMAERALLPSVRGAAPDALIVADGTSCRHQIADGAQRAAVHACRVLAGALDLLVAMTVQQRLALGAMPDVVAALQLVPGLSVQVKTPLA